jgi:hypothetical protein
LNGDDRAKSAKSAKNTNTENAAGAQDAGSMDHDGMWKDLIRKFFPYLLKRAIPGLYAEAELSAEPKFLDKEFRDILNTADPAIHKSPHYADYVLEVLNRPEFSGEL